MSQFSVISSVISPGDLATYVKEKYGLEEVSCRLLKTGINHTYQVNGNRGRFIFRVYCYQWRSPEEIQEELNLLQLLHQHSISVSYPIEDTSGNFIQTIQAPEGVRYAVLFSHAPGKKIQNYGTNVHAEIGRLMARIHSVTHGKTQERITYTPEILLDRSIEYISAFLPPSSEEMQFLIDTKPVLEKYMLQADPKAIRKGIVHMDIWFDNLNISDDHRITLFDFDFCGNGWLCLDIAYYILQLHAIEKDETERNEKIRAFYEGYESVEKITGEEKKLVPVLGVCMYYFYLGIQCRRFNDWSNTFINDVYLQRFIRILIKGYYDSTVLPFMK